MNIYKAFVIILILFAGKLCFFNLNPVIDPSESRYASTSLEMAKSGDFVTPKVRLDKCKMKVIAKSGLKPPVYKNTRGEFMAFWGKPPLHFWASAMSIKLFGKNGFGFRMASHLAGLLLLLMIYLTLKSTHTKEIALIATLGTACSLVVYLLTSLQMTDSTLCLFVGCTLFSNYAMLQTPLESKKKRTALKTLTVIFLALGFLTKGPIAIAMLAIPLLLWIAFTRQWELIKTYLWLPGAALFSLICAPWFIIAELKTPGFCSYFFIHENIMRFISKDYGDFYGHGHIQFYGAAIVFMFVCTLPFGVPFLIQWFKRDRNLPRFIQSLKENQDQSYFFISFFSMTLFWCLTRKLLLSYLIPLTPMCFAWGAIRYHSHINLKRYYRTSLILLCLYPLIFVVAIFIIPRGHSTLDLLNTCEQVKPHKDISIYFVRRTMDSSLVYGKNIIPHPPEAPSESYNHIMNLPPSLVVIEKRYLENMPKGVSTWKRLATYHKWIIFQSKPSQKVVTTHLGKYVSLPQ